MDSCDISSDLYVPSPIPPAVSPAPLSRARLVALAVWPTLAFVVLFGLMQETGFDAWVAARFHDPALGGFPLRDNFWTSQVLHEGAREVLVVFAVAILALWLLSWPVQALRSRRKSLAYLLVAITLSVVAVHQGKQWTNMDCPWDVAEFGGQRPHLGLFDDKPDTLPRGHCFPGGHSSGGFALLALYFAGGGGRSRSGLLLLPGLLIGSVFAVDQWMRGAHFPSHDLTSAYLCWMIALGTHAWFYRRERAAARLPIKRVDTPPGS
ncbi:MAG: phosphatase PAP2 family protein [Thiobacillus sp.]|uniref:phosphatase PAP2 family protein n=1 Tax=Thiobacillus sp. TaxID=924 RepID=UPI002735386B|nr:phosphatase PAP2 family protein [Thiobacillus sp.]MDP3583548.1 phosphatase PAP2 family protein [Thiobacillus sp.]